LYCGSCGIYLATNENNTDKLLQYAIVLQQSLEETFCDGCRAPRKSTHCDKLCTFIKCQHTKALDECGVCNEFPCKDLLDFKSILPHRIEILESQDRLKEIGLKKWLIEMHANFSCSLCNTTNSAYDISCRKCGNIPSCRFVMRNRKAIEDYLGSEGYL